MRYLFPLLPSRLAFLMILLAGGFGLQLKAASYDVFMVQGEILYEGSGEGLAAGMTIASGERVKFKDPDAFAVLIGKGGRYTLKGSNLGAKFKAGEFVTVKSATQAGKFGLKARPRAEFKKLDDIKTYLSGEPLLILRETQLPIPAAKLGLAEDVEFFLRFNKNGEHIPATKPLPYNKGLLSLDAGSILAAGPMDRLSDFKLMLFTGLGEPAREIAPLKLVVPDEGGSFRDEITQLVQTLHTTLGEDAMEPEVMKQQVLDYLVEYYGQPTSENFEEWVVEFL